MTHRRYNNMNGRDIINSFGNLNHEYLFNEISNLPNRLFVGKESVLSRCSSNCQDDWIFNRHVKELEEKKLPYKVVKRLEWYEPNEEKHRDL